MIDVDRPATPSAAPTRRSAAVWVLVVLAALWAVDGLLPWERVCRGGGGGFPEYCFHAPAWSGTAAVAGLAVEILAVTFLFLAIWRGWARSGRLTLTGIALATAFLALAWTKVVIVLADGARTAANSGDRLDPATTGTWVALALGVLGFFTLVAALFPSPRLRRALALVALVSASIAGLGLAYASSGLAWWGGPLAPPTDLGTGGFGEGATAPVGDAQAFGGQLILRNAGPWTVTLDGVDVVPADPALHVIGVDVFSGTACPPIGVGPASRLGPGCRQAAAGTRIPPGSTVELGVIAESRSTGLHRSGWFRIRYQIGPWHFEMFQTDEFEICTPATGYPSCPGY